MKTAGKFFQTRRVTTLLFAFLFVAPALADVSVNIDGQSFSCQAGDHADPGHASRGDYRCQCIELPGGYMELDYDQIDRATGDITKIKALSRTSCRSSTCTPDEKSACQTLLQQNPLCN